MIKTLRKVGIEGALLNIIKATCEKPTANIILMAKTKSFPSTIRNKTRISAYSIPIQHSIGILATAIRQEKEIKGIQIGKEKAKFSFFADDIIVYIGNPTDSTKKLLNLTSEFGKPVGYKVNIQKTMTFLYTNNKKSERNQEKIPFDIATRKIKYPGIYLTNEVTDLYSENYTTLKKEIKGDTNK